MVSKTSVSIKKPVTRTVTTTLSRFQRVFGTDYKFEKSGDQPLSEMALFLKDAWSVFFDVQRDPKNADNVIISVVPNERKGLAPFARPDSALKAIMRSQKIASPEETQTITASTTDRFRDIQIERLLKDLGEDGALDFNPSRKIPYRLTGFNHITAEMRKVRENSINAAWSREQDRLKVQLRHMPLTMMDLVRIEGHTLTSAPTERMQFETALTDYLGHTRKAAAHARKAKVVAATPLSGEAVVYIHSSLAVEIKSEWQQRSKTDSSPRWGNFLTDIASIAGIDISYVETVELRPTVLEKVRLAQQSLERLRMELALIQSSSDKTAAQQGEEDRIRSSIVTAEQTIRQLRKAGGEAVYLSRPLSELTSESAGEPALMAALHVRLRENAALDQASNARLQATVSALQWLVYKKAEYLHDFTLAQQEHLTLIEAFWRKHPEYKGDAVEREASYELAVQRFTIAYSSANNRQDLQADVRRQELQRIAKQDPSNDRPTLKPMKVVSLEEVREQFKSDLAKLRPATMVTAPAVTPAPVQAKTPKQPLTEELRKAEEEISRRHVSFPLPSQAILTAMQGDHGHLFNTLKSHFGVKLLVRDDQNNLRILVPIQRNNQGRIVENNIHLRILPVLAALQQRAEISQRALESADVQELLAAETGGARPAAPQASFEPAANDATLPSPTLIPLTSRLPPLQLSNLIGVNEVTLRKIAKEFPGLTLQVDDSRVCVTGASLIAAEREERGILARLTNTLFALQGFSDNAAVTELQIRRAVEQSFAARQVAGHELGWSRLELAHIEESSLIDRVMLDAKPTDITYTPREFVFFTELGKSVLKRLTMKDGYLLSRIKEATGLAGIQTSENSITLIGKQKKIDGVIQDGRAKLEEVRNLVIELAHVIYSNRYTTMGEFEAALHYLRQAPGATLPTPRPLDIPKSGQKMSDRDGSENDPSAITSINTFIPEGNQIYAQKVLKDPKIGIAAVVGPAGSGKTELAQATALQLLADGDIDQIILATPMLTVGGREIGFLPGDKAKKISRFYVRHRLAFAKMLAERNDDGTPNIATGVRKLAALEAKQKIVFEILEDMRGNNYERTVVITDEPQNATPEQILTAVTRITETSKIWLVGDLVQQDGRKAQGEAYKVPNYIHLKAGMVHIMHAGRWSVLGEERKIGRFFYSQDGGQLSVKPHNGFAETLLLDSNDVAYGLAILDRSDIHRHNVISRILAIREAAIVVTETCSLNIDMRGTFDTEEVLRLERERIQSARGRSHRKVVQLRQ